jgi:hypothetical protein
MVRGVKGFDSFDTLADLSDGLGLNIERKDEKESTEGQSVKCPLPAHHSLEISRRFHLQILSWSLYVIGKIYSFIKSFSPKKQFD